MSGNSPHEQQATGAVLGGAQASQEGEGIALPFTPPNGSSADTQTNPASNVAPVAQSRGGGWALPASAQGATPFRRPIRVVVKGDQLLILPDRGDQSGARVVPLNGPMQRTIDHFVAQIWEHMNGWGIAGAYAYWKPILSVEIAPGGEARFAELAALMQQSGVEVERK